MESGGGSVNQKALDDAAANRLVWGVNNRKEVIQCLIVS